MNAFTYHFFYEIRQSLRDRSQLLMSYGFPLLFFFMVGTLMTQVVPGYTAQLIPAMILFGMLSSTLLSLPTVWIQGREQGVLRSWKINGVSKSAVLFAPLGAAFLNLIILSMLIIVASIFIYKAPLPSNWLYFISAWLISALCCCSLGLLIGTIATNNRMGILLGQLLYLPGIMLGGLMFPVSFLPSGLSTVSKAFPAHWAMVAMQASSWQAESMIILSLIAFIALAVSVLLFEWHSKPEKAKALRLLALLIFIPGLVSAL